MSVNGTLVEDKMRIDSRVNVHILASASVTFTLMTVQVPILALNHTKRITVCAQVSATKFPKFFSDPDICNKISALHLLNSLRLSFFGVGEGVGDGVGTLYRSSENRLLVNPQLEWNKWSCKLYLEEKVQLDHSSKNQWINIPSISKQLMADPLFRNQGQKLAARVPDPAPAVGSKWRCRKTKESMFYFTQKLKLSFHSE